MPENSTTQPINRRRGIYLLPNLLTTAGLFAAFYSIVAVMQERVSYAAIAIFIAMICDAFDGRIARLTHTESEFGAEYDSLADVVSFGVAPALLLYGWLLHSLGKIGWLVCFLYTAAAALRLARFNTQIQNIDKRYFQGLPSPAAAGLVASTVWLCDSLGLQSKFIEISSATIITLLAVLMVSNIRFHSFKEIDWRGRVSFVTILIMVLVFIAISLSPPLVLFLFFLAYGASGPILTLYALQKKRLQRLARRRKRGTKTSKRTD